MKRNIFSFGAGVLSAVVVFSLTITVFAASGSVSFNVPNINFNGQRISSAGEDYSLSNGTKAPSSISYIDEKGGATTYLPVRRVAELLDVEIGWEQQTKTVVIGADNTIPPEDYSGWASEEEVAYQDFKSMWSIELIGKGVDENNRTGVTFSATYVGDLTHSDLVLYLNAIPDSDRYYHRLLLELREHEDWTYLVYSAHNLSLRTTRIDYLGRFY